MEDRQLIISNTLSNRKFGLIFSLIFLIINLYFLFFKDTFILILGIISLLFFLTAILLPNILGKFNNLWFIFGKKVGSIISMIIMFSIYALTIIPTGLIFKLFKKDLLKIKMDRNAETYWIKREENDSSLKNQF